MEKEKKTEGPPDPWPALTVAETQERYIKNELRPQVFNRRLKERTALAQRTWFDKLFQQLTRRHANENA